MQPEKQELCNLIIRSIKLARTIWEGDMSDGMNHQMASSAIVAIIEAAMKLDEKL